MMLKDDSGQPSLTRTLYAVGFIVCCFKLLVSGMTIGSFQMSQFTGVDFAAVQAALGAVYHMKKTLPSSEKKAE